MHASKIFVLILAAATAATACSRSGKQGAAKAQPSPSEIVNEAYAHLIKGEYSDYLLCTQAADSLPASYRQSLINVLKQAADNEKAARGGIAQAKATSEERNKDGTYALVRVDVLYGDSTKEEIAVQTVKTGGQWRLK